MADEDLFDVFDEKPTSTKRAPRKENKKDKSEAQAPRNKDKEEKKSKKRAANGNVKATDGSADSVTSQDESMNDATDDEDENHETNGNTEQHNNKRQRTVDEPKSAADRQRQRFEDVQDPVVADTFETEQSREVQASAGLQAHKDDKSVVISHQVRHQVSLPPDYNYVPLSQHKRPEKPAREWKFTLDPFQEVAVMSIERNESVLVSAHTSAGKTVVAEYAIAQCLKNQQRVVYTSPIKALSNQKYREFREEFGDVGLMTGDVTINPTATCLVMTTEILRSMLYRGSEIMREVGWVIFDEVHYMRDKSRGVVWEETIILLPDNVRYVFLSATIPNAMQFAEWITKTHNQPCHVVYTDFRPTPLQHYIYPSGADGIHLVVDEKGVFREDNFDKAMAVIADKAGDDGTDPLAKRKGRGKDKKANKGGQKDEKNDIYMIVKMLMTKSYHPVIVFSFSKREVEAYALKMSQLAFNDDSEKALISQIFNAAIKSLPEQDQELPQIQKLLPLLRRGIGIHHSGLLPILKETIELLFQEGLIKVLFATETFSIGLNMPAKTVVFTSVRKFDGTAPRWLTSSEFIQMSGRAGRRGLDDRGIVIMMIDEKMEPTVAKEIVRGQQDKLNSAFYLGYNMVLNLLRVESISPEFMLERCFHQFQHAASVTGLEKQLREKEQQREDMEIDDEASIKEYYDLRQTLTSYVKDVKTVMTHPQYLLRFLQPGRLVKVKYNDHDFGWGAVVSTEHVTPRKNQIQELPPGQSVQIAVLLNIASDSAAVPTKTSTDLPPGIRPPMNGEKSRMEVVPVMNGTIDAIAVTKIFLPKELRTPEQRNTVRKSLEQVGERFPDGLAVLDPVENMGIQDEVFKKTLRKIEVLEHRLLNHGLHGSEELPGLFDQYSAKIDLGTEIRAIRAKITAALSVLHMDELKNRKRVLRRLNYINDQDVVQLKARIACEISTGDELVLSELLVGGFFNQRTPEQLCSILSVFVFEEKSMQNTQLKDELAKPFREILAVAKNIAKVSIESKVMTDEEAYLSKFKPELMETTYAWAHGASFSDICTMTDVYEGSLIRLFRRLEELIRQLAQAAQVMGSDGLIEKFKEALTKLKRDIVGAPSLYL